MRHIEGELQLSVTRIVLIRHADFVPHSGLTNPGLSKLGRAQCELLQHRLLMSGELLEATTLLCSPLARARQTADLIQLGIGSSGCRIIEVDDLREMHWGAGEGLSWGELVSKYGRPSGPFAPFAPGGESWTSFVERATSTLDAIAHQFSGRTIVIVAHTGIIEASFVSFAGLMARSDRFAMAPRNTGLTSWMTVASTGLSAWRLELYNDANHLWVEKRFRHRDERYASLGDVDDPFWQAVGRDIQVGKSAGKASRSKSVQKRSTR